MRPSLALACLLLASPAAAQYGAPPASYPPPPPAAYPHGAYAPPGYHQHDGFFLRLAVGLGGINQTALSLSSGEVSSTGAGTVGLFDVSIGGIIGRNLALHFSVFGFGVPKEASVALPAGGGLSKLQGLTGGGVGLTWYTPSNFYVTGAVGGATMQVATLGVPSEIRGGFAMEVGAGKEWWVSANWGLGLVGLVAFARISDPVGVWNTAWAGVAFSATYN